ncbi:MAG: response regulator [Candidatus Glassbacteria bacterium]|nr:response regulator [Candidatus Glassbacteria bacterium]
MRDLLTPRELAELCGVSPDTVRSWCFRKQINFATTPGGHKRFRRQDVLEFLKARGFPLPQTGKLSPIRVLVVDDDDAFRNSLVGALQKEVAFNVKEASDGYEAGRMIGEFQPDVLILDLVMPGIDGFKVCRNIRASEKSDQIKIIVVTGFPDEDMFQGAREAGADECLAKPVEIESLIELIRGEYQGAGKRKARGRKIGRKKTS